MVSEADQIQITHPVCKTMIGSVRQNLRNCWEVFNDDFNTFWYSRNSFETVEATMVFALPMEREHDITQINIYAGMAERVTFSLCVQSLQKSLFHLS